ncbi:MAG: alkaline phosphatase D family protein [Burkholderiaceae bacterium]
MTDPDRRRLLALATACATSLWVPRSAWSQPRFAQDPFSLGVASGSPAQESVVLWTRLAAPEASGSLGNAPITVRWEIAHDEGFQRIARSGQAQALPELAFSVHVEVQGLEPDRWYFYRFTAGNAQSATGRTRTFPAPGAAARHLRLAYASCQRWEHGYYAAWRHMREENPDVVLFLGDYIYEYPNAQNAVRSPGGGWCLTLADYRRRYALHRSDAALRDMHAACPWVVTWDDHEVQNDYTGTHAGDSGPPVPDFLARRAAAYQAYYEHMPLRASALTRGLAGLSQGADLRVYGQLRFGNLVNLCLLDARQYKDAQVCTPGGKAGSSYLDPATCPAWEDPNRTLLGAQQEAWLAAALAEGGATWSAIGQQSVFAARDARPGPDRFLWNDGWDGYPASRARVTAMLRGAPNPVFFGGDVHENWVGHVKAGYGNPSSESLGVEFCGTSITSRSAANERLPQRLAGNPHFVFADNTRKGYGIADFTPKGLTTRLRVVGDVTREDTGIETLAQFHVQAGRPVVERA